MATSSDCVVSFKFIIIGDTNVGKSNLVARFVTDRFSFALRPTIGIDFRTKTVDIDGNRVKLTLWDTAGEERYKSLAQSYFRGSNGVCAVYDVTNRKSFENVKEWMDALRRGVGNDVDVIILGNKSDLESERVVTLAEGEALAKQLGVTSFVETSALNGSNVDEAFNSLAKACFDTYMASASVPPPMTDTIKPGVSGGAGAKKPCCA